MLEMPSKDKEGGIAAVEKLAKFDSLSCVAPSICLRNGCLFGMAKAFSSALFLFVCLVSGEAGAKSLTFLEMANAVACTNCGLSSDKTTVCSFVNFLLSAVCR